MKKTLALILSIAMVLALAACGGGTTTTETPATEAPATEAPATEAPADETPAEEPASDGIEIALVTDVGNIDDKSFNEGSWNGVVEYATANNVTYDYYRPFEDSNAARIDSIKGAIDKGAKVIVCPGYLFEESIYDVQNDYPDVNFLLLDGEPHDASYSDYQTAANTHCILYKEEQAGYLAGYAAVMEGYTQLGFLGGMNVPAVVRYGYGFVQGADAAAAELGLTDVNVKYWYAGGFGPTDDIRTKMDGWYTEGTEVVFACGGGIYLSCVAAAEAAGAKVIGVDVDQAAESPLIITSAMKNLTGSVVMALEALYGNGGVWPADYAGQTANLGADVDGVGLPTAASSWRLENYSVDQYNELFDGVKNGSVAISNAIDVEPTVSVISVDYQG